ncbi:hypothetical protein CLV59_105274 [Chitinophaga dinghuensis]|uniref:Uncharacterized protein n=1 Tax=Chitinophaga dinghuensis TaxID=1539050 RepID=A0A327VYY8_9BACT|nr:hypothetical protein [Chitinophaga dinghuensis]RAJ80166.1 hypothetical protein CLV59_105274 [Chitinophaga dinghuensis]
MHVPIETDNILFHALKHHYAAVQSFLAHPPVGQEQQLYAIRTFGGSQFDLYHGKLSVAAIEAETVAQLSQQGIQEKTTYHSWIASHRGYRTITLSDGSNWTLRYIDHHAYIHLHPSRYSPHTIRIKANAMKSIVCYLLWHPEYKNHLNIPLLNHIRQHDLHLSPIATNGNTEELQKVLQLLGNDFGR